MGDDIHNEPPGAGGYFSDDPGQQTFGWADTGPRMNGHDSAKQKTNGHAHDKPRQDPPHKLPHPVIDPINWEGQPIAARQWIIPDLVPFHVVTMLSGDGGLGKSTLALQMAVAAATGGEWIGKPATRCKTLIVACEDDPDELHRRLYDILANSPHTFGELEDIRIISGSGHDNVLVAFEDFSNHGKRTEFCEFVEHHATEFGAQLVILDSLHDFFAGNENARPQARQFINHLRRIAINLNGAVLLLAHPSLSGLKDRTGNAGSTAWNNTVRSRLYLARPEDPEANHLVLRTMKANYAASGNETRLQYRGGCFHNLDTERDARPVYEQLRAEDIFLTCLRETTLQGRRVTESTNGNFAPKVFATMSHINRSFGRNDFQRAMSNLFNEGRLKIGPVTDAARNTRPGLIEVPKSHRSPTGNADETQPENHPEMASDEM